MAGRATRGGRKTITPETGISAKFDDTEYKEQGGGYDGPPPPDGLYPMELVSVKQHTISDDSIEWLFRITGGKYDGWRGWMYTNMGTVKWKTQNILVALGLMEPEGEINQTFEAIMKGAGPVRGRIKKEYYEEADEHRAKLQGVIKSSGTPETTDADEEDDEDFDDEEEKKPAAKAKPAPAAPRNRRGAAKKEPEPEPEDDEDEDDEEEGLDLDALEEELEDMSLADLKKKAKEFGAKLADYKGLDEEELIDLILEKAEAQSPSF